MNKFKIRTNLIQALLILLLLTFFVGVNIADPKPVLAHDEVVDCGILVWVRKIERINGNNIFGIEYDASIEIHDSVYNSAKVWDQDADEQIQPNWGHEIGISCDSLVSNPNPLPISIKVNTYSPPFQLKQEADISASQNFNQLKLWLNVFGFASENGYVFKQIGMLTEHSQQMSPVHLEAETMAFGKDISWSTGYVASIGDGNKDNDIKITFEVLVLREPDFHISSVDYLEGKEHIRIKNNGGPGVVTQVACWQNTLSGSGPTVVRSVNIPIDSNSVAQVEISSHFRPGGFTCSVLGKNWFGGVEPHSDNNSFSVSPKRQPSTLCIVCPRIPVFGQGGSNNPDPEDEPIEPPLNTSLDIKPGFFIDKDSALWKIDLVTERGGKRVTRQITDSPGILVEGPTGSFFHTTLNGWISRYMFFGDNNHLLILDSSGNVGQVQHNVYLVNFTTTPPTSKLILSGLASDSTIQLPNVQYSQGNGNAFLIFNPTGSQIANATIYRSDNGTPLCGTLSPFIATGETQGEATTTEVIIHYSTSGQNYKAICSIDSTTTGTSQLAVNEVPLSLPPASSLPDCRRPSINDVYVSLPPSGSTATFRLYFSVEGADKILIFGNEPHGPNYFDVWSNEPGFWFVWAKIDGTPDECYAEKGLFVDPGTLVSTN